MARCSGTGLPKTVPDARLDDAALAAAAASMGSSDEFIAYVTRFGSLLRVPPRQLPDHVVKAVRMRARSGSKVSAWRHSQLRSLESLSAAYPAARGPRTQLMGALLKKAGSRDQTFATDAKPALQLTGILPASGRGAPVNLPEGVTHESVRSSLADLLTRQGEERSRGFFRLPGPRRREMLELLRTEKPKGFCLEFSMQEANSELKRFCSWLYFGAVTRSRDAWTHANLTSSHSCGSHAGCQA